MRLVALGVSVCLAAVALGCGGDQVWDCQTGGAFRDPGQPDPQVACERSWSCNQANANVLSLQVRCTKQGDGLQCSCFGNGVARGRFEAETTLCDGTELEIATKVNDGCRWSLPVDE